MTRITGLILAGGMARRMGPGADKAFLSLAGRPLLAHVLERLSPQLTPIVISGNGNLDRFAAFGLPVLADLRSGFQGPLAGVEAAFAATGADWILSVAVDLPFLPTRLVERMREPLQQMSVPEPVVAVSAGQHHYVVALWPRSVVGQLTMALANGRYSLRDWFQSHPYRQVVFLFADHEPDPFFNINRPADLSVAETLYQKQAY
ncbi:MAG: molybdenum cofactor guanylyltransferase [Magnetococcales bacterium]|nr:molybdenum cofactor guanylyltransferase [Magnetococcales bacterium]